MAAFVTEESLRERDRGGDGSVFTVGTFYRGLLNVPLKSFWIGSRLPRKQQSSTEQWYDQKEVWSQESEQQKH
jgi:hypothetical protein